MGSVDQAYQGMGAFGCDMDTGGGFGVIALSLPKGAGAPVTHSRFALFASSYSRYGS
jgi:hypothetical protein